MPTLLLLHPHSHTAMAHVPSAVVSDGGGNTTTAAIRLVDLTKGGDGRWIIGIMIALVSCVFGTLGLLMSKLAHTYETSKPVRAWCCGAPPHSSCLRLHLNGHRTTTHLVYLP